MPTLKAGGLQAAEPRLSRRSRNSVQDAPISCSTLDASAGASDLKDIVRLAGLAILQVKFQQAVNVTNQSMAGDSYMHVCIRHRSSDACGVHNGPSRDSSLVLPVISFWPRDVGYGSGSRNVPSIAVG